MLENASRALRLLMLAAVVTTRIMQGAIRHGFRIAQQREDLVKKILLATGGGTDREPYAMRRVRGHSVNST